MREFETLFDVYIWATRSGSVVDTNPQIFHPCGLFEEDMQKVEKIFERALKDIPQWATHYYAKRVNSLTGDEIVMLEEIKNRRQPEDPS